MHSKTAGHLHTRIHAGYLYAFLFFLNWRGMHIYYALTNFNIIKNKIPQSYISFTISDPSCNESWYKNK